MFHPDCSCHLQYNQPAALLRWVSVVVGIVVAVCVVLFGAAIVPTLAHAKAVIDPAQIDTSVVSYLQSNRQNMGVSVVVSQNSEILSAQQYGLANRETSDPITQDTVFRWGRASEMLAWVSILQLAEAKQVKLDEDVRQYLPDGFEVPWTDETVVTLNQLINGTAGMDSHPELAYLTGDQSKGVGRASQEYLDKIAPYHQVYPVNSVINHSEYDAYLCAAVVEHMTQMPYARYVERHIFIPLNMSHTCFDIDPTHPYLIDGSLGSKQHQLSERDIADITEIQRQGKALQSYTVDDVYLDVQQKHSTMPAATGVMGTTLDMARFARALTGGSNESLFHTASAHTDFWNTNISYRNAAIGRIASGLVRVPGSARLWTIEGHAPGTTCTWYFSPEDHISMVVAANSPDAQVISDDISRFLFGSPMSAPAESLEKSDEWMGVYQATSCSARGVTHITSLLHRLYVYGDHHTLMVNNKRYEQLEPGTYLNTADTSLHSTLRFASHPNFTSVASFADQDLYRIPNDLLLLEVFLGALLVFGVVYSALATFVVPLRAGVLLAIRRRSLRIIRRQSAHSSTKVGVMRGLTRAERLKLLKHYGIQKPISIDEALHPVAQIAHVKHIRKHHVEWLAYVTCVFVVLVTIAVIGFVYALERSLLSAYALVVARYLFIAATWVLIACAVVLTLRTWHVITRRIKEAERLGNLAMHGFKEALSPKERAHLARLAKLAIVRALSAGSALSLVINLLYWQIVS